MANISKHEKKIAALQAKISKKSTKGGKEKKKMGTAGRLITKFGTQAVLTLVCQTYKTVGPIPVSPDIFIGSLAGLSMLVTKKGSRQLSENVLEGAVAAFISRLATSKTVTVAIDQATGRRTMVEEERGVVTQAA